MRGKGLIGVWVVLVLLDGCATSTRLSSNAAPQPAAMPAPTAATPAASTPVQAPTQTEPPATSPNNPATHHAAAVTSPAAPSPHTVKPKTVAKPTGVAPQKPAPAATLDLASLEQRLRDTRAIGVFTKLSLKNQVDDLLDQFRAYHRGEGKASLADLRESYNQLLLKVLGLLQNSDAPLASAISSSRDAIWAILSDPNEFAKI
jgi:hypothetical protein